MRKARIVLPAVMSVAFLATSSARAEVIEEIVVKVNDDIITKSEFEREEQGLIAELYRRYTGAELDARLAEARAALLGNLIDRKLLIHRAERLYDLDKMKELLVEAFMEQQNIEDKQDLERLLAQDGMTVEDLERRLLEMQAPDEVIRFEVVGRTSVGDREVEAYYETHAEEFEVQGEVSFREIVLLKAEGAEVSVADAENIRERILAGEEEFADVAREVSESATAAEGGLVGPFKRGDLAPELEEEAFTVPVGEVSRVVETEHGFHIIRVESRTETLVRPLEEVREEVRRRLEQERFQRSLDEFLKKARAEANIEVNPQYRSRYQRDP